jgi:hypothetical protein
MARQFCYSWRVLSPSPTDVQNSIQNFRANANNASCNCAWHPLSGVVSAIVGRDERVVGTLSNAAVSMYDALFQADEFLWEHDQ